MQHSNQRKEAPHGEGRWLSNDVIAPSESYLHNRLLLFRSYFNEVDSEELFERLQHETKWLSPSYTNSDGRVVHLPRLTANYGERSYNYSGLTFVPEPWTPLLQELLDVAQHLTSQSFNALILQQYRDGRDGVGWHSDDDPCVAPVTTIVSMSFGATRRFNFRNKEDYDDRLSLHIHSGDIVIMQGNLQKEYVHKVPKEPGATGRINLTFRQVLPMF